MNIKELLSKATKGNDEESITKLPMAGINLPNHTNAIEIYANTIDMAREMRNHILELLTGEPIAGPLMLQMKFERLGHPQIELLNALDALGRHYVVNQTGYDSMTADDFASALKYFADVVESE